MKRYQKLIIDAVGDSGYTPLAREIGVPSTSVHEWATQPYKTPHFKSLEKIAAYFKVPVPVLLMEVSDLPSNDDAIIMALYKLTEAEKAKLVELINSMGESCQ